MIEAIRLLVISHILVMKASRASVSRLSTLTLQQPTHVHQGNHSDMAQGPQGTVLAWQQATHHMVSTSQQSAKHRETLLILEQYPGHRVKRHRSEYKYQCIGPRAV